MHVLIVGAGIGGLGLAQCLRKQGISFDVYERDQGEDSRFQGWSIGLHTIIDRLQKALPNDMPTLKEATNHLDPLPLPAQLCLYYPGRENRFGVEDKPETPLVRSERYRLRHWLLKNIPVHWNKGVQSIEHSNDSVTVHFEDGTSATGDILVGADGINSIVREQLLKRPNNQMLKAVPLATVTGETTFSGEAFERQLSLGHSAYIHARADLNFFVFNGLHRVTPDGKTGLYYWTFMQPDANVVDADYWIHSATQQEKLDYVLSRTATVAPKLREIIEGTPASGIKKQSHIYRDLELSNIPTGRVVLLGDAAHAMTPFRGEGGYHALIDAMDLSETLVRFDAKDNAALKANIANYNENMLDRGRDAVRKSRKEQALQKTTDTKAVFSIAGQEAKAIPEEKISLQTVVQV